MDEKRISFEDSTELFLQEAEKRGLTNDVLFSSTFSRYQQLIKNLTELQKSLNEKGLYYTDESGKLKVNPALTVFNTTCAGADRTAALLYKIISRVMKQSEPDDFENY